VVASAYIEPVVDPSRPVTAAGIHTVFRMPAGRFGRDRACKRLYAKGFPDFFEPRLWSAKAVPIGYRALAGRTE
jgi:hypothetical protein